MKHLKRKVDDRIVYTDYMMNPKDVKDYEKYERTIKTIQKRFKTYGYQRVKTSTFESYDLYSQVGGAINQKEMIKVIARSGEVLVLRPDGTIPITKQVAENNEGVKTETRYFYIQDIFRQSALSEESIETTQAGIECFAEGTPETDAEVIALAIHTLRDLGFSDIKIEMGHAGFFQALIQKVQFTSTELDQLKNLVKAKNIVELQPFLESFTIDEALKKAIGQIPMLYGNPVDVIQQARPIAITPALNKTLDYLLEVYEILELYGVGNNVVVDLGLINQMGYYSDVIFQGFVEKFGKPVLMGGRYDQLGEKFGATLPAIGFACEIESLIQALGSSVVSTKPLIEIIIIYDANKLEDSINLANELRERHYRVLTCPFEKSLENKQESLYEIKLGHEQLFEYRRSVQSFSSIHELLKLIDGAKGGV